MFRNYFWQYNNGAEYASKSSERNTDIRNGENVFLGYAKNNNHSTNTSKKEYDTNYTKEKTFQYLTRSIVVDNIFD